MISVIFRIILIFFVILVAMAVIGSIAVRFTIGFNFGTTIMSFLSCVFYLLPMDKLFPVIVCAIGLILLRIIVSTLKTIWDILPLV